MIGQVRIMVVLLPKLWSEGMSGSIDFESRHSRRPVTDAAMGQAATCLCWSD